MSDQIGRRWNGKHEKRRRGGRSLQLPDWFRILHSSPRHLCTCTYVLRRTNYIRRKKKEKKTRRSGVGMDMQNMCANFQGLSLENGVDISTLVRETWVFYVVACKYLVLVQDQEFALCTIDYSTQAGQIVECLRETFYRHALEYLQSPRSEKNGGKIVFLRKRLSSFGLLMACSRWGHVFATSTNSRSRKKEGGHVSLFYCSLGRI